jgi:hypothetical protein
MLGIASPLERDLAGCAVAAYTKAKGADTTSPNGSTP